MFPVDDGLIRSAQLNKGDSTIQMHSLKHLFLIVSLVGRKEPDPLLLNSFDMETHGTETLTGSDNPCPVAHSELNDTIICICPGCRKSEDERERIACNECKDWHYFE